MDFVETQRERYEQRGRELSVEFSGLRNKADADFKILREKIERSTKE